MSKKKLLITEMFNKAKEETGKKTKMLWHLIYGLILMRDFLNVFLTGRCPDIMMHS